MDENQEQSFGKKDDNKNQISYNKDPLSQSKNEENQDIINNLNIDLNYG